MTKNRRKRRLFKPPFIYFEILILLVLAFLITYKATNHFGNDKPVSASAYTKGNIDVKGSSNSSNNGNNTSTPVPASTDNNKVPSTSVTLTAPTGDFISDHSPNLSGSPAPNTEASTCSTTPGAYCTIEFTNTSTGAVKSLSQETTDEGGSAYWNWTLQSVGLTTGTWQVKAVATLGTETQSASDAMNMVVSQ
jgi:hypothetical protein